MVRCLVTLYINITPKECRGAHVDAQHHCNQVQVILKLRETILLSVLASHKQSCSFNTYLSTDYLSVHSFEELTS